MTDDVTFWRSAALALHKDAHAMFPDGDDLWVEFGKVHLDREAVERFSVTLARIDRELEARQGPAMEDT